MNTSLQRGCEKKKMWKADLGTWFCMANTCLTGTTLCTILLRVTGALPSSPPSPLSPLIQLRLPEGSVFSFGVWLSASTLLALDSLDLAEDLVTLGDCKATLGWLLFDSTELKYCCCDPVSSWNLDALGVGWKENSSSSTSSSSSATL